MSSTTTPEAVYQTCLFCKKPLGSNEVIESFPVGRRLAFDSAKGRLWVVCTRCKRWNLTPLEERWEAVEACERVFRETPMRASTENVGIARHREGLDLVRIGTPERGEFAAWRYGDQFRIRYRNAAFAPFVGLGIGMAVTSLPLAVPAGVAATSMGAAIAWHRMRTVAKVRIGGDASDGGPVEPTDVVTFRIGAVRSLRLLPADQESRFGIEVNKGRRKARFVGENARRVASALVPKLNERGGPRRTVQHAVQEIESAGHPDRFLNEVGKQGDHHRDGAPVQVRYLSRPTRLALEMSLHEQQERRALEGELWMLEQAWKEAEEIAAISDNLLLPAGTDAFFDRYGEDD